MTTTSLTRTLDRDILRPACGDCFALCCTAFGFSRSADFAVDKPAGSPCQNLNPDFSCAIHARLRPRGFRGCTVFDCFGAGQAVSQRLFAGVSWRGNPAAKQEMFAAFKALRQLHEMLWYLAEAQERTFDPDAADRAQHLMDSIAATTQRDVPGLLAQDLAALHADVRSTLIDISEEVRAAYFAAGDDLGPELIPGADLRDARLEGADLSAALYLTQPQINAARGGRGTRLPRGLSAPPHWGMH
jgi:hypothetical protein